MASKEMHLTKIRADANSVIKKNVNTQQALLLGMYLQVEWGYNLSLWSLHSLTGETD